VTKSKLFSLVNVQKPSLTKFSALPKDTVDVLPTGSSSFMVLCIKYSTSSKVFSCGTLKISIIKYLANN
jgi:hypothetical protein